MSMIKKIIFSLVLFSFSFSQGESLATTRFEKFWYSKVNTMKFREPFTFMPINLKIGYFQYGGNNYLEKWDDIFLGGDPFDSNPISFENEVFFTDISKIKNRTMLVTEIALMKYNFFKEKQNIIDIQIGLGYKYIKALELFSDICPDINPAGTCDDSDWEPKSFKPKIDEFNINTTFSVQFRPERYYALYYAIGYADAVLYKTTTDEATGTGLNQSFGIGVHFIKSRHLKRSQSHHGFELRFDRVNIDKIKDPLNIIKSFKAEQIGIMYSFGIGYGGKKSLGDEAYKDMLKGHYIFAVDKFQNFKNINKIKGRKKEIDKLIEFGNKQIPYEMYSKAIAEFNAGYLEQALWWLNKAFPLSDEYLHKKIQQKKMIVISNLLKDYLNEKSLNEQIDIINGLIVFDPNNIELNNKLSSLLIKKANYYLEKNNFFDSYILYKEAIKLNPYNESVVKIKYETYLTKILNHAYNYLQNNDNVIAYELLSLVSEFSDESNVSKALYSIADNRLNDEKIVNIRNRIQNILYSRGKDFSVGLSEIYLGQDYIKIVESLGHPIDKVSKRRFDNYYELTTFKILDEEFKLFFKNKILIDVERAK